MRLRVVVIHFISGLVAFAAAEGQRLVVLQDTGRVEGNLPVVEAHPNPRPIEAALNRGYAARLVRLDHIVQQHLYARGKGPEPEPMYLVISRTQGGFPRQGFVLNGQPRPQTRWVDLHRSLRLTGSWGSVDQIFSHELAHVIMVRLTSAEPARVPVQTHAVGVRTTSSLAFQEGFGEHAQIMAADDPGVDPATAALTKEAYWRERAEGDFAAYRRELEATVSAGAPMRLTFPLWFSNDEQVFRYYGVKANAFARKPSVPSALINTADPYRAYLLERVLPASPQDAARSAAEMVATEGVISHLFWRWVTSLEIGRNLRDPSFYASFGVDSQHVDPLDNAYLKIFAVVEESQAADIVSLVRAYEKRFPDESPWLDQLVKESLLGQSLPASPNLWIVNPEWRVGTTLFDQWRAVPQPHCFDLNASDGVDLANFPGVSSSLAQAIRDSAPYKSLADLAPVPGMTEAVLARFHAWEYVPAPDTGDETGISRSLRPMLLAYLLRMLGVWLCVTLLGTLAVRALEPWGWGRALWRGVLASSLALPLVWMGPVGIKGGIWIAFAVLAIPSFLWRLRKRVAAAIPARPQLATVNASLRGIIVWAAALLPTWIATRPWF